MLRCSQIESLLIEARCSSVPAGKARQPPEGKGPTAEGRSGCLPVWILGRARRSFGLSQVFVERYRGLAEGENPFRFSVNRLQSDSFFFISTCRLVAEKPEGDLPGKENP